VGQLFVVLGSCGLNLLRTVGLCADHCFVILQTTTIAWRKSGMALKTIRS